MSINPMRSLFVNSFHRRPRIPARTIPSSPVARIEPMEPRLLMAASPAPDLVIEGGVKKLKAGDFVAGTSGAKAEVKVVNRGDARQPAADVVVTFYVSTDATLDNNDSPLIGVLKNMSLKVNKSQKFSASFNYPDEVPDGHYFILAKVDTFNLVDELNESNNVAASPFSIGIADPFVDLTGTSLTRKDKFKAGKKGSAALVVQNSGNVRAIGTITQQLFVSADNIFGNGDDVLVTTAASNVSIKPGKTKKITLKADLTNVAAGNYTLFATIDATNALAEKSEINNRIFSASQIAVT